MIQSEVYIVNSARYIQKLVMIFKLNLVIWLNQPNILRIIKYARVESGFGKLIATSKVFTTVLGQQTLNAPLLRNSILLQRLDNICLYELIAHFQYFPQ